MKSATQQPTFRDKRLPESNVWTDVDDLRWNFLFGGLFVAERPIDLKDQPSMGGEDQPDFDPTPETEEPEGGSTNIDEAGDVSGEGDVNPDADDAEGESEFDSDADTDSEPDHQPADNDGDETADTDEDEDGDSDSDTDDEESEDGDDFEDESEDEAGDDGDEDGFNPDDFGFEKPDGPPGIPGYERIPAETGFQVDHIRTFDSWYEFVTCASDMSLRAWRRYACADTIEEPNGEYYATETMDQAVSMALWTGWPEGRDMLIDSMAQVVPTNAYRVTYELDVAGAYPMVPVYVAGDPACMVSIETESMHASRPIVRIDYNNTCSHYITPDSMMRMGAAVLSFAQSLEMAGYSTELRIIGNARSQKNNFRYNVTYKRAGEPLDLDRAAFAIAHPSVLRRFMLGLMEQHEELAHFGSDGHGFPMRVANDPTSGKPGGAIYIPPPRNTKDIAECKAIIETAAQDLINQLTKAA